MGISFNEVPSNLKVPFVFIEFDNTRAQQGPSIQPYKVLIMGQKLAVGTKAELLIDRITNESEARQFYGAGSHLSQMIKKYLSVNRITEMDAIAIDDNGSAVDSTGTITLTGPSTEAGTLNVYVGGRRYQVAVANDDSETAVAASIVTAITDDDDAVVTAGNVAGVVTFTAKNGGLLGDEIDIRVGFFSDDKTPAGLTTAVVGMDSGATNPDVAEIIAELGEVQYNLIVMPWLDSANLLAMEAELSDRFGPLRQNDGYMISAKRDSLSGLGSFGTGRNSKFLITMGMEGPNSPWEWAAQITGQVARSGQNDPARPFQTLELPDLLPPTQSEQFTLAERNILLDSDGIATYTVDRGGIVRIERLVTTFKTNEFGADDRSFFDLNTLLTLSFLRFDFRTNFLLKFPRHKLANDGARVAPGQVILTPKIAKAEAISKFRQWEELGLVEGIDQFKNDLIVERNVSDPNRLDILLPPDLVNQLRVTGVQIQFLL